LARKEKAFTKVRKKRDHRFRRGFRGGRKGKEGREKEFADNAQLLQGSMRETH